MKVLRKYEQNKLKVLRKISIEVPSDLQALDKLLSQFNEIYQEFVPERDWLQCRLALAEGFTNAVRHAHKNLPSETIIRVEVLLSKDRIKMRIWDSGAAFDLRGFTKEKARSQNGWLNSGRGIPLLNKIADRLEYSRTGNKYNCLLIVKKF